jgi:hypothetical protein
MNFFNSFVLNCSALVCFSSGCFSSICFSSVFCSSSSLAIPQTPKKESGFGTMDILLTITLVIFGCVSLFFICTLCRPNHFRELCNIKRNDQQGTKLHSFDVFGIAKLDEEQKTEEKQIEEKQPEEKQTKAEQFKTKLLKKFIDMYDSEEVSVIDMYDFKKSVSNFQTKTVSTIKSFVMKIDDKLDDLDFDFFKLNIKQEKEGDTSSVSEVVEEKKVVKKIRRYFVGFKKKCNIGFG